MLCKVLKCVILTMLLTQVKPSYLRGFHKVTQTRGGEGKIPTYGWFLGRLSSVIPAAFTLCSVYQKLFVTVIPSSVPLNLVVSLWGKTEESFQTSPMEFSDSIGVPDWDVLCQSWELGVSDSKAKSDVPKTNHSASLKKDNGIAKAIRIAMGLIFHSQNTGKATLPFKFSYVYIKPFHAMKFVDDLTYCPRTSPNFPECSGLPDSCRLTMHIAYSQE